MGIRLPARERKLVKLAKFRCLDCLCIDTARELLWCQEYSKPIHKVVVCPIFEDEERGGLEYWNNPYREEDADLHLCGDAD